MYKQNSFITRYCLTVVVILALFGPLAQNGRGDFVLLNDEQLTVNSSHNQGTLFDRSRAFIVTGGSVTSLYAYDSSSADISSGYVRNLYARNYSTVDISGGLVDCLDAYDYSTVDISGGSVGSFYPYHSSTVNISGGEVSRLDTCWDSTVDISGGNVDFLYAYNRSTISFHGRNFSVSGGLSLYGNRVLGTGTLIGEWMDGTLWSVNIQLNDPTATIQAIPEPAMLLLLGLGAVMLRRKR